MDVVLNGVIAARVGVKARVQRGSGSELPGRAGVGRSPGGLRGRYVSERAFRHAVALLRLIVERIGHEAAARFWRSEEREARWAARYRRAEGVQGAAGAANAGAEVLPCAGTGRRKRVVEAMLEYVRRHFGRPMTLAEVGEKLGMNASYLSDLFSRATGITFHHYVEEMRLRRAKAMLRDPLRRVADVAAAVGYASDDWFRHAFRAHTGRSPSEWRDQAGCDEV